MKNKKITVIVLIISILTLSVGFYGYCKIFKDSQVKSNSFQTNSNQNQLLEQTAYQSILKKRTEASTLKNKLAISIDEPFVSEKELIEKSSEIVIGKVTKVEQNKLDSSEIRGTKNNILEIELTEKLKSSSKSKTLGVLISDNIINGIDYGLISEGDVYLFILEKKLFEQSYKLLNYNQGLYEINSSKDDKIVYSVVTGEGLDISGIRRQLKK